VSNRIGPHTAESLAFSYATFILSIPKIETEGLIVYPGMGEDERVRHAVARWNDGAFSRFLVCGLNLGERSARRFDIDLLQSPEFDLDASKFGTVETQIEAGNTKVQSDWAAQRMKDLGLKSATLTASAYHLPRAYMTLLKSLSDISYEAIVIPEATPVCPSKIIPEEGWPAFAMTPREIARITHYQSKGHVVTWIELMAYLKWLYKAPVS
jgi:hypothetical protein